MATRAGSDTRVPKLIYLDHVNRMIQTRDPSLRLAQHGVAIHPDSLASGVLFFRAAKPDLKGSYVELARIANEYDEGISASDPSRYSIDGLKNGHLQSPRLLLPPNYDRSADAASILLPMPHGDLRILPKYRIDNRDYNMSFEWSADRPHTATINVDVTGRNAYTSPSSLDENEMRRKYRFARAARTHLPELLAAKSMKSLGQTVDGTVRGWEGSHIDFTEPWTAAKVQLPTRAGHAEMLWTEGNSCLVMRSDNHESKVPAVDRSAGGTNPYSGSGSPGDCHPSNTDDEASCKNDGSDLQLSEIILNFGLGSREDTRTGSASQSTDKGKSRIVSWARDLIEALVAGLRPTAGSGM